MIRKGVFKMGKVVITREQADKIKGWEWHTKYPNILLELHVNNALICNKCLQSLTLDELARALYVGYEVAEEFEQGDWVVVNEDFFITIISNVYEGGIIQLFGNSDNFIGKDLRHATPTEIEEEEKRRMDKKINEIWIDLSDYERNGLYKKLVRGDY